MNGLGLRDSGVWGSGAHRGGGASSALVNGALVYGVWKFLPQVSGRPCKVSRGSESGEIGTAPGSDSVSCSFSMNRVERKVYRGCPGGK